MSGVTPSTIEVAVRVRPLRRELYETQSAWNISDTSLVELAHPDHRFTFDRVYSADCPTSDIYKRSIQHSIVAKVAAGYNGTIFAYGQTGSGKSFTMFGDDVSGSPGLIQLAVQDLFTCLGSASHQFSPTQSEVFISMLEIYNEQLRDLLFVTPEGGGTLSSSSALQGGNVHERPLPYQSHPHHRRSVAPTTPVLSIRENEYGMYVHNAVRRRVDSVEECLSVIQQCSGSRVAAATAMNEHSSRSHCVIRIVVEQSVAIAKEDLTTDEEEEEEEEGESGMSGSFDSRKGAFSSGFLTSRKSNRGRGAGAAATGSAAQQGLPPQGRSSQQQKGVTPKRIKKIVSTLNMVDLAGSERVAKTGAVGMRMVEGGHINKSLTILTTVINRLVTDLATGGAGGNGASPTGGPSPFIPYRDSRLTHLLKTALGGNSVTAVLCCITPAVESVNESRSTLQFASRAKKIRNRVHVNEVVSAETRIRELEATLRRTKRILVAQTIYLWSKQVKIRNYEQRFMSGSGAVGGSPAGGLNSQHGRDSSTLSGEAARTTHLNAQQQQSMIIAQLTAQNAGLLEEVQQLRASLHHDPERSGGGSVGACMGDQLRELQQRFSAIQEQLSVKDAALSTTQTSLDELDELCRELEIENKQQATDLKGLTERNREAEQLMEAVEVEHDALQKEIALVRSQLAESQGRLLEKHRGDAYLEELTRLHIAHQSLQFSFGQLKEKASNTERELMHQTQSLMEKNNTLEDELDDKQEEAQLLNSFLWRLVSAVMQLSKGRPIEMKSPGAVVREAQVTEAIRLLTQFGMSSSCSSSNGLSVKGSGDTTANDVEALRERVRQLEQQIVTKDAQRDVIIDSKLKRIQGMVLRLHTINLALVKEMRQCFSDNAALFDIASLSAKTQKRIEKAGLAPQTLQTALERANFAPIPQKPFAHN